MTASFGSQVYGIPDRVLADVDRILTADLRGPVDRTETIADIDPADLPEIVAAFATHVNHIHAMRERHAPVRAAAVTARDEAARAHAGGNR